MEVIHTSNPLVFSPFYSDRILLYFDSNPQNPYRFDGFDFYFGASFRRNHSGLSSFLLAGEVYAFVYPILWSETSHGVGHDEFFWTTVSSLLVHQARGISSHRVFGTDLLAKYES